MAAVASGQPETAIEHTDYRNKLSEIRTIYHQEVIISVFTIGHSKVKFKMKLSMI